tara:strand:+ start:281 stop:481 length:201 start_codon:yes stop_codon:yes gene_type:complete
MFRTEDKAMPLSTASKLKTSGRKNFQMEQEMWEEKLVTIKIRYFSTAVIVQIALSPERKYINYCKG